MRYKFRKTKARSLTIPKEENPCANQLETETIAEAEAKQGPVKNTKGSKEEAESKQDDWRSERSDPVPDRVPEVDCNKDFDETGPVSVDTLNAFIEQGFFFVEEEDPVKDAEVGGGRFTVLSTLVGGSKASSLSTDNQT